MTDNIRLIIELSINKGKADEVKAVAKDLVKLAAKEKSTDSYEFFVDKESTRCMFVERYADNDAVLAHLANVGEVLPKILANADLTSLRVLGPTNDAVQNALIPMGATFLDNFASAKITQTV